MIDTTVTTENIKEKFEENEIMLIQFWAPWCGPCRALTPTMDDLEEDFGKVIGRCNTDDNQELVRQYGIKGIPAVIMFKNGEEVERFRGNTKDFFTEKLNYYIGAISN